MVTPISKAMLARIVAMVTPIPKTMLARIVPDDTTKGPGGFGA
jgi:hypothetical protein